MAILRAIGQSGSLRQAVRDIRETAADIRAGERQKRLDQLALQQQEFTNQLAVRRDARAEGQAVRAEAQEGRAQAQAVRQETAFDQEQEQRKKQKAEREKLLPLDTMFPAGSSPGLQKLFMDTAQSFGYVQQDPATGSTVIQAQHAAKIDIMMQNTLYLKDQAGKILVQEKRSELEVVRNAILDMEEKFKGTGKEMSRKDKIKLEGLKTQEQSLVAEHQQTLNTVVDSRVRTYKTAAELGVSTETMDKLYGAAPGTAEHNVAVKSFSEQVKAQQEKEAKIEAANVFPKGAPEIVKLQNQLAVETDPSKRDELQSRIDRLSNKETGQLSEQGALEQIRDIVDFDPAKVTLWTNRFNELKENKGLDNLEALNRVQLELGRDVGGSIGEQDFSTLWE